jgi:hypothetical protein
MGKSFWKLVPKLHPDHEAKAPEVAAERKQVETEMKSISMVARTFWPPAWSKRDRLLKRLKKIDAWKQAALAPIGFEFEPPCIGVDDKATDWYRKHLDQDPEAWPLPPDEMIEEMMGTPVWELTGHPLLSQLDLGWVASVVHVPPGPGIGGELRRRLERPLAPDDAFTAAEEMEAALRGYMQETYPAFAAAGGGDLAAFSPRNETALELERRKQDGEALRETSIAIAWLRLWAEKGYAFELGEQSG